LTTNAPCNGVQTVLCKTCKNHAKDTPLRGVYVPHFGQISVKIFQFWWSYTLIVAPMRVKFNTEASVPNFTPIRATCRPCEVKNLKIGLWVT